MKIKILLTVLFLFSSSLFAFSRLPQNGLYVRISGSDYFRDIELKKIRKATFKVRVSFVERNFLFGSTTSFKAYYDKKRNELVGNYYQESKLKKIGNSKIRFSWLGKTAVFKKTKKTD